MVFRAINGPWIRDYRCRPTLDGGWRRNTTVCTVAVVIGALPFGTGKSADTGDTDSTEAVRCSIPIGKKPSAAVIPAAAAVRQITATNQSHAAFISREAGVHAALTRAKRLFAATRPAISGGWLSTHTDITALQRNRSREAKSSLGIAELIWEHDFSNIFVALNGQSYATLDTAQKAGAPTLNIGLFINALINFVIIARNSRRAERLHWSLNDPSSSSADGCARLSASAPPIDLDRHGRYSDEHA